MEPRDPQTPSRVREPLSLAALGLSKRRTAVVLAALILVLLSLALLTRIAPGFETWQSRLAFPLTQWLNPGELSAGHATFGAKCSTCHDRAFTAVGDARCTECHRGMASHLDTDHGKRGVLETRRCADCHAGHAGKAAARRDDPAQCTACHQRIDSGVAEARDFGGAHPPFKISVPAGKDVLRIAEDAQRAHQERSGLKFSHQVHLNPKGVSSPEGDTILGCPDCHRRDEGGRHFVPVTMKLSCQQSGCHNPRYAAPARGKVPHGSVREAVARLTEAHVKQLAGDPDERKRACSAVPKGSDPLQHSLDCAQRLALAQAGETLFRDSGSALECALCHEISSTGNATLPWKIMPVQTRHDWMPKAVFPHDRHEVMKCGDCHDKANSTDATDIAFPGIGRCRECHAGAERAGGKLPTGCGSCHLFHRVADAAPGTR